MKNTHKKQLNPRNYDAMSKDEIVSFLIEEQTRNNELETKLAAMQEMFKKVMDQHYGKKSEKTKALKDQLSLIFDEVEVTSSTDEELESELDDEKVVVTKKKQGRKKISESNANLEVVEIVHPMDELIEAGYEKIGEKTLEKYRYQPAKIWIDRHIYPVYQKELEDGCTDVKSLYEGHTFLKGSGASESLVASVINDKYAKSLPLYRIEQSFKDLKADISRQTMSNWLMLASRSYLTPLYECMKHQLLQCDILHADETTVKVINHQDGSDNQKSYMWLYRSGVTQPNILIYEYQPGRGQRYPKEFLEDFKGYLHSDGYEVYKNLDGTTQVGCLAHGRRKIVESLKSVIGETEGKRIGSTILKSINHIFSEDKKLSSLEYADRKTKRDETLKPLFDALKNQLSDANLKVLPSSVLGKAIQYNLNQFEIFQRVLLDGRLELTNNRAERGIKPFVIGRKNWMFSNTTRGAKESGIMYSIVQSAKENGLRVEPYLIHIFESMSQKTAYDPTYLDSLLPHSKSLPDHLYIKSKPSR